MDTVSALNSSNSTSAKFDTSFAWFLAFMLVTVFLLFVLLTVICILAYFVYRLRRQSACLPSGLDADGDVIYGFSNKHAEFIECRSSVPASNASLTDPWNTRLGRSVEYCDCHLLHREEFERRRDNLLRRGVQFHTYPKVGVPVTHNGWMQRVLSQPGTLHFHQSRVFSMHEEQRRPRVPRNKMVERLLMEAVQQEVNLTWPK
ncbi:hypothetical protein ECG_04778 [Echinococcus granulosus]|uniref:Uncharacterized protein n=1 Tax=Echinococcus granulosus TaxID=6210 RepID=A0A068WA39_ECHGR|nr:hypothetical protein ECG_04778 [Echinococcus granulosus]CDS16912.1 hypothetical protein EgrG_000962600 [Echinococcus granulosus]